MKHLCNDALPGIGNVCGATSFLNTSGSKESWDLHLAKNDTANRDASPLGPGADFDQNPRPQGAAYDIGADELLNDLAPGPPASPRGLQVR